MVAYNLQNLYKKCSIDIDRYSPCPVEAKAVRRCRSVRDIDTVITSQIYGIDVDQYYDSQSSISSMPQVAVPTLCLNSRDDPLIDPALGDTAVSLSKGNDNVVSVLTSHGGHIGWVEGWRKQWMCKAVGEFLVAVNSVLNEDVAVVKAAPDEPGAPQINRPLGRPPSVKTTGVEASPAVPLGSLATSAQAQEHATAAEHVLVTLTSGAKKVVDSMATSAPTAAAPVVTFSPLPTEMADLEVEREIRAASPLKSEAIATCTKHPSGLRVAVK
jgi:hypothetical protein